MSKAMMRPCVAVLALLALGACDGGFDFDLRDRIGDNFSTAHAAKTAVAPRPDPDDRGIISYPNYQVAVAKRGDTVTTMAERVGLPAGELADYNGIAPDVQLRRGEVIALPRRVAEPSPDTGAVGTGPILPPEINVTELATTAIESSAPTPPVQVSQPKAQTGVEPIRHKVVRGETAYTISRLYNVSVKSLAEWNGLDRDFTIREGQFLLIPVVMEAPVAEVAQAPEPEPAPGQGSPTPTPPSSKQALPTETPEPAAKAAATKAPVAQDLGKQQTAASKSNARMQMPVDGRIIREYVKGTTDGIDITNSAGTPIKAADSGIVASITKYDDNVPIVIIKHTDNLMSVYINAGNVAVKEGDSVSRGQKIGALLPGSPPYLHFEVRRGFDSVDPMEFLQ
ncbi:M23 family metallopeptidase [Pseudoprimorskyibacter insulae]|uniref:Murein hydrolase activator NlpD n=1 Tax=Pseudoprimorskyibacter insulae TaxID=1695997 RepID=A0A2R8AX52_9RHOB|nr:M23 family metallopeptidase [Pseudoprimorskyibacter insulae]SPF80517.1 Murein hydrolase activator NlpD [Pseudoprimorskyibacter insulae]